MIGLLIDLDGVLYQGDQPVTGGKETIQWLRQQKIPHLFLVLILLLSCQASSRNDAMSPVSEEANGEGAMVDLWFF